MIALSTERRLLQATVALACLVPLSAGGAGALLGPAFVGGVATAGDLDSHFRYLSGLLLAIGIGFLMCLRGIEAKGARFRVLGGVVIIGGLARTWGFAAVGLPSLGHSLALVMELGVVPCLMAWQMGFARRWAQTGAAGKAEGRAARD